MFLETEADVAVDLKGAVFTLPVLQIHTASIEAIEIELKERLSAALKFFQHAPVVIDLEKLKDQSLDFGALLKLFARHDLVSVGVRNGTAQQNTLAIGAGLAVLKGGSLQDMLAENSSARVEEKPTPVQREVESVAPVRTTKVVTQPVRSGQQIYAKGGDLIVMAAVNPGAEIVADGNIHVYAPMKGRALAGVLGDVNARIFCQSMEAELIAIAGNFRVFEDNIPSEICKKNVQAYLAGEQLVVVPLKD